jgi:intron-binding protein aquarius
MRDEGCADREVCDYRNTFLNLDHVRQVLSPPLHPFFISSRQSFPTSEVEVSDSCQDSPPPYRLSIRRSDENSDVIQVLPYRVNPFLSKDLSSNSIKFTPRQIEAIRSGMNHGLSIVVGPPGTGKTEVALQLICNLYHNFPTQRILVVTHSNRALNELFEKILKV